uniref:Uncharacterized protein n=1 Tax=Vespula pensylvanica TaxID=30213 RepID=A0A834N7G9_VESPE|nr:hypothetical protein H0235_016725 [Vespula pensylvanica]
MVRNGGNRMFSEETRERKKIAVIINLLSYIPKLASRKGDNLREDERESFAITCTQFGLTKEGVRKICQKIGNPENSNRIAKHGGGIIMVWSRKYKIAEQSRAEQSRAEQSRAEQSRAEQSRAEQSRAEQSRAEQSRAEQSGVVEFYRASRYLELKPPTIMNNKMDLYLFAYHLRSSTVVPKYSFVL